MKKVLVLLLFLIISIFIIAQDTVSVPVYLKIPQFAKLELVIDDTDGQYDLEFLIGYPEAIISDNVWLRAKANTSYTITYEKVPIAGYEAWSDLITIEVDESDPQFGHPGIADIKTKAEIDIINNLELGYLENTQISTVIFTMSQP